MRRLTFYIMVSLLTFTFGIAVSFWLMRRPLERTQISESDSPPLTEQQESAQKHHEDEICKGPVPEVEAVYLSHPLDKINRVWYNAHIIIFHKNGDWVRVWDEVRKEGDKLVLSTPDGYRAEVGTWKREASGLITVSIEKRRCHTCGFSDDYRKPAFPIIEHWLSKGIITGPTEAIHRKYRQIREDQVFHDIDRGEFGWDVREIISPCIIRFDDNYNGEDY